MQKQNVTFFPHRHQVVNEEGSREYEDEDTEAYRDYQGSEEYQYNYDGDDYPSYEEDYSEEQVHICWENFCCCFNLDAKQVFSYIV